MSLLLAIEPIVIEYTPEQLEAWKSGPRSDCPEGYCKGLPGSYGFGEYLVGRYWEERGYCWIHHDFSVFGGNRDNMYLEAQAVLKAALGPERFEAARQVSKAMEPFRVPRHEAFEEPDLLIYKQDMAEVRFAECKRPGNRDQLRPQQGIGLFLLGAVLRCPVDVFLIVEAGKYTPVEQVRLDYTYGDSAVYGESRVGDAG